MAELFYREERDRDFFNVCEQVRSKKVTISVSEIVSNAILMPAKYFYLRERGYSEIIKKNGTELPKNEIKKMLHLEILERSRKLIEENPNMNVSQIAKIISEQSAPRFYISKRRAEDLYYTLLKKSN